MIEGRRSSSPQNLLLFPAVILNLLLGAGEPVVNIDSSRG